MEDFEEGDIDFNQDDDKNNDDIDFDAIIDEKSEDE